MATHKLVPAGDSNEKYPGTAVDIDTMVDGSVNKVYTAAEKTKLSGVATGATANSTDAALLNRQNHTGNQSADTLTDGTTNRLFTAAEKSKLGGIATGATANASDAALLNRGNHTGTQPANTITGLGDAATKNTGTTAGTVASGDDSRFGTIARNLAGGRSVIATRLGFGGTVQAAQNVPLNTAVKHRVLCDSSDIRLGYGVIGTTAGPNQVDKIKVGLRYNGSFYRVTFSGRQTAFIEPYGLVAISDPVGIEVKKGEYIYSVPFQFNDWGYTPLAAAVSAGATSFTTNNRPGALSGSVTVESAREVVEVAYWDGTAAPYTCYLKSGTTFAGAHASGAVAGGVAYSNFAVRNDLGDLSVTSSTDYSWTTTAFSFNGSTLATTLTQAVVIGDTFIKVANASNIGPTCTVEGEVLTVRNVYGTANPYTVQLTSPATAAHASGVAVAGSIGVGSGLAPIFIVADRTGSNRRGTVVVIGDSIPNGTGNLVEQSSYAIGANGALELADFAVVNLSISGEAMFQLVDKTVSATRRAMWSMGDWCLFTPGVNDAYSSRTSAQMIADATALLTDIRARGLKVIGATLTPRTATTDAWVTTGNQTTVGAASSALQLNAYNDWVRANSLGLFDKIVDFADATMTARNSNIWKADASGPYTTDGIHPSYAGHMLLMKPALANVLSTI